MREPDEAPEATVEALMFELRDRGMAALAEQPNQRRLAELSDDQITEVLKRLSKLRAEYPVITDDLLAIVKECRDEQSF
jgi:hypothetical protein